MRRLALGVVSMCAALSVATAGPLEDAEAAYARGDYAAALRLAPPCEAALQSYSSALAWLLDAADQGDSGAQLNLGNLYYFGRGVPKDYAEAALWYRSAADQGVAAAQLNLGYMYDNGQGVPPDSMQALVWLELAADPRSGSFFPQKAARMRDAVAAKLTPAQVAEARQLAMERMPR